VARLVESDSPVIAFGPFYGSDSALRLFRSRQAGGLYAPRGCVHHRTRDVGRRAVFCPDLSQPEIAAPCAVRRDGRLLAASRRLVITFWLVGPHTLVAWRCRWFACYLGLKSSRPETARCPESPLVR
jgi:hypothetical protein